jgi:lysophospholipase L1-like esterase
MRMDDGQLVAFMGDSITEHLVAVSDAMETQTDDLPAVGSQVRVDRHEHRGWTAILANRIQLAYPERQIRYINSGIAGDTSRRMLARFDADILAHRPQWLMLSAGVVEVRRTWQLDRKSEAVPLDEYAANLTLMVSRALTAGAQVILLEPTPHAHPVTGAPSEVTVQDVNTLTRQYAKAMMQVASEARVGFVPLFDSLLSTEQRLARQASLYADEVHLNARGDLLYAELVYQYLDSL